MARDGLFYLVCTFILAAPSALADEMAFVDVSSTDSINIRYLDVPVNTQAGFASFLSFDPMESHDWSSQKLLDKTLAKQIEASERGSGGAAERIGQLERLFEPLYPSWPKNEHGRLNNGTVRWALHRYFAKNHGWSVKGLEPAGASWIQTLEVAGNVRELSKYMVPTYLHDQILVHGDGRGLDARMLAVLVATIEQLVHVEMTKYLYGVFRTLHLPTAGPRSREEVDDIVTSFMMVYAFGSSLEVSAKKDLQASRGYLETHHQGWRDMQVLLKEVIEQHEQKAAAGLDFQAILILVEDIAERYGGWQSSRDCQKAKNKLISTAGQQAGRVPVSAVSPSMESGHRSFFTEDGETLDKLGILVPSETEAVASLVIPNYIVSQTMCLSTASYYTVCCPNECEAIVDELEVAAASPVASADKVISTIQSLRLGNTVLSDTAAADLHSVAEGNSGNVELHSQTFGDWLHRAFPYECPASAKFWDTNPKMPSDWMKDPGPEVSELEHMMDEIAAALSRYTTLGKDSDAATTVMDYLADDEPQDAVIKIVDRRGREDRSGSSRASLGAVSKVFAVCSMLGLAVAAGKSAIRPGCHDGPWKSSAGGFGDWLA
eukprot:TRINITY_DN15250_c0_g1_i2.p1 TRINITY_DN15250_c0_g1~~TRINITY_DN15250_c0_g1_i2.p1  ORF type:complete len:604 (+),score=116.93 TRINITY_DN15250_c0_g1_i2:190-2001(+)